MFLARFAPLLMLVPAVAASQVPSRLAYQGRLTDANGEPMGGKVSVTFAFYSVPSGGSPLWTETQSLGLTGGFYSAMLGSESALDPTLFSGEARYLELSVNGAALAPRQEVGSVAHALLARAVSGGVVDASEVRVNGKTVIDSTGAVKGAVNGVTYTRWGRTTCPAGSSVVYNGYAAGSHYTHGGSGSNTLCLIDNPKWDDVIKNISDVNNNGALLYGIEFETDGYGVASLKGLQNYDARCVVCEAPANLVLMIPGTTTCPASWTLQYFGFLMANNHSEQTKSEFVCVDAAPEQTGSQTNSNGSLWYPTETECGSLPCPPYVQDREVACAVCTK